MIEAISNFIVALEAWESCGFLPISDRRAYDAEKSLISATVTMLQSIPGVDRAVYDTGTMGSLYFAAIRGDAEVKVRVSNHSRKPNQHAAPAWSFEVGDSTQSVTEGCERISIDLAEEVAYLAQ